jgi:serine protease Do
VAVSGEEMQLAGAAVNLTSDGLFLSSQAVLANRKAENLFVKLDDGSLSKITAVYLDPASDLALLKASFSNAPVANINPSSGLKAGERVILLAPTLRNFSPSFQSSFVSQDQLSDFSTVFDSDRPLQAFGVQGTGALLPGQVIADMGGNVVGLWDGDSVVAGDTLRDFVNGFLGSGSKLARPEFGFLYRNISAPQASALKTSAGAAVTKVTAGSPAQKAGLEAGDIITAINGFQLTNDSQLGMYLQKIKPGDKVKLSVARNDGKIELNIVPGELK